MADLAVLSALAEMHRRQARLEAKLDALLDAIAEDDDEPVRLDLDGNVIEQPAPAASLDG